MKRVLKNKKVLITGGAGFIGSKLTQKLSLLGCQIKIVDKAKVGSPDLKKFLTNPKNLEKFDLIFHLAGNSSIQPSIENPRFDLEQNVGYTLFLLESLKQLKKQPLLVYASSAAVYGVPQKIPIRESNPLLPISPYGISKMASEHYIAFYAREYGINSLILRFFSVYGPGQEKQIVFKISKDICKNKLVETNFHQSRDFIYIDDLIEAVILVTKSCEGKGEVYNIATGQPRTIKEIAEVASNIWNVRLKIKQKNDKVPSYVEKVDISKIKKLGFQPKIKLEDGIRNIKEWLEKEKNV